MMVLASPKKNWLSSRLRSTESGASSDSRFCHKFSSQFHCLVGHTKAVGQPGMEENYKSNFQRKINKTYYPS